MASFWNRLQFIWCVAAVVLLFRNGETILFGFAALVAFANLFSSQLMCALGSCKTPDSSFFPRDPTMLIHRVTAILGLVLLLYASLTSP